MDNKRTNAGIEILQSHFDPSFKAAMAKQQAAGEDWRNEPWRTHFSNNAQDLIQIQRAFVGEAIFKQILMACFRATASRNSEKINVTTVENVLDAMPSRN
jgi:hypothetical protein